VIHRMATEPARYQTSLSPVKRVRICFWLPRSFLHSALSAGNPTDQMTIPPVSSWGGMVSLK
jgi:hypothetical protein